MDTLAFLRAILPDEGQHFLAIFDGKHGAPAHKAFDSLESMAAAIDHFNKRPELAIYHACAAYREPFIIGPSKRDPTKEKRYYRVPSNWLRAKAFWIDIDCGEDKAAKGDGYAKKRDALQAVHAFCTEHGFPMPMVVDSGGGLHCYWPLTKAIKPEPWRKVASVLKAVLKQAGVLADPSRTADFSSVLRPVGSFNRKRGTERPVKVVVQCAPITPEDFTRLVSAAQKRLGAEPEELFGMAIPAYLRGADVEEDLAQHAPVTVESSAVLAADRCAQMAQMRDTQGDVGYEHWRGVIGVIVHSVEDESLAEEWSARRAETGHSQTDARQRYEDWNSGPTTCEFFNRANPGVCEGCPFWGKIKSPIVLGRVEPEPVEEVTTVETEAGTVELDIPPLPRGYEWREDTSRMVRFVMDANGVRHAYTFCPNRFWVTKRIRRDDGKFMIGIRMILPDGRLRDFEIDTALIADKKALLKALGEHELMVTGTNSAGDHLTAYLRDSLEQLKQQSEEINTYTAFGWNEDMSAFLIGDRLYCADGSVRRVLLSRHAAAKAEDFPKPIGTVERYAAALNSVYNHPGMEPLQYAICSGFGSILTPLGEMLYNGLGLAITGRSGIGKSTVCWATLYAFGDAMKMSTKTDKGSTENSRWARMGTYGSLPALFDEMTSVAPAEFSRFAYTISLGEDKERLTSSGTGVKFVEPNRWRMSPYITANSDVHALLARHTANSEAEAVRIIQISMDRYDLPKLSPSAVAAALSEMARNRGKAGELFIQYVVTHITEVQERFRKRMEYMDKKLPEPKYRFYRNHAACTLTACEIMQELGIVQWDADNLELFAIELMKELAGVIDEQNALTAESAFHKMVGDLAKDVLVTYEFRGPKDGRGPEPINHRGYGPLVGRYVVGNAFTPDPEHARRLYLSRTAMRAWCGDNRMSFENMLQWAKAEGIFIAEHKTFNITAGVDAMPIRMHVLEFDMTSVAAVEDDLASRAPVQVMPQRTTHPKSNVLS